LANIKVNVIAGNLAQRKEKKDESSYKAQSLKANSQRSIINIKFHFIKKIPFNV